MCVWVYQFVISYQSGLAGSYMSLSNDDYCDPVQISFQDEWALDDGGYWSSNPRWGFAASMLSIATASFKTTEKNWLREDAPGLYNTLANFNTELEKLGSGHAAVRMVRLSIRPSVPSTHPSIHPSIHPSVRSA
jgi:hypothetical protein